MSSELLWEFSPTTGVMMSPTAPSLSPSAKIAEKPSSTFPFFSFLRRRSRYQLVRKGVAVQYVPAAHIWGKEGRSPAAQVTKPIVYAYSTVSYYRFRLLLLYFFFFSFRLQPFRPLLEKNKIPKDPPSFSCQHF